MRLVGKPILALIAFATAVLGSVATTEGHALQPAYLEIRPVEAGIYAVVWKTPAAGGGPMPIVARLPEGCKESTPPRPVWDGTAYVARWTAHCVGGLAGGAVTIDGLTSTQTDVLLRIEQEKGGAQTARLTPTAPSFVITAAPGTFDVAHTYLALGIKHILMGIDHLLFVLGLLILVSNRRRLVWTISAFTAAHSITLAAATLGYVRVAPAPVEAVIALSIVFVATEIVHTRQGRPGMTERWPWVVSFAFGLLHGFGFAGALAEIGLPEHAIPLALFFFNVGVEVGQLMFVAVVLTFMAAWRRIEAPLPDWAWRVPAYAIGSLAAYWTIERTVLIFV